jgi:hypothetical protein
MIELNNQSIQLFLISIYSMPYSLKFKNECRINIVIL